MSDLGPDTYYKYRNSRTFQTFRSSNLCKIIASLRRTFLITGINGKIASSHAYMYPTINTKQLNFSLVKYQTLSVQRVANSDIKSPKGTSPPVLTGLFWCVFFSNTHENVGPWSSWLDTSSIGGCKFHFNFRNVILRLPVIHNIMTVSKHGNSYQLSRSREARVRTVSIYVTVRRILVCKFIWCKRLWVLTTTIKFE